MAERVLAGLAANHFEPEQVYAYIIKRLCAALDAARAENAALRADLATARASSPWHDEPSGTVVDVSLITEKQFLEETSKLERIWPTSDAPTAGEESRYFNQFLRESEGE